jgi:hypothetical protein
MIQYATRYGFNSTDEVLNFAYQSAHFSYFRSFQQRLLDIYNFVKPRIIQYTEECNGQTIMREKKPENYRNLSQLQSRYSQQYFIELYCKIRFEEEESEFTENERQLLIDDVIEIANTRSDHVAISQFETVLNKTFDYQGSLSYNIKKRITARDASE